MSKLLKKLRAAVSNDDSSAHAIQSAVEVIRELRHGNLKARAEIKSMNEEGRFLHFINEMAEELETLVEKNKLLERSKTAWLQEMAHDLRTPLASIELAQTTLLESDEKLSRDQKKELVEDSLRETNHIKNLVEDLLFLSLLDDPAYFSAKEALPAEGFFESLLDGYSERAKRHARRFELTVSNNLKAQVLHVNQALLKRLCRNCVDNALSYCATKLRVHVDVVDKTLSLKILNDGNQMTDEQIQNFGRRREAKSSLRDARLPSSLGLGSVIIQRATLYLGARLTVTNVNPQNSLDREISSGIQLQIDFPLL